jgi:hypothetical protein
VQLSKRHQSRITAYDHRASLDQASTTVSRATPSAEDIGAPYPSRRFALSGECLVKTNRFGWPGTVPVNQTT